MNPTVKEIYIYPVKSCKGILLDKCIVTKYGMAHPDNPQVMDRKWMVVDENGTFQTQRQIPKMALIKVSLENDELVLNAPEKEDLRVPIKPPEKKIKCRVWNLFIEGFVYEERFGKWFSEFLEKQNLQLVNFGYGSERRKCELIEFKSNKARETDFVVYQDYSPFMLISENSLIELNTRLTNKITILNFRPNFFIKNCEPFAEDNWDHFKIGEVKFSRIKHCTRCILTTVNPKIGVKDPNQEPLKTLKTYRQDLETYGVAPKFGINIAPDSEGNISVGDPVTII